MSHSSSGFIWASVEGGERTVEAYPQSGPGVNNDPTADRNAQNALSFIFMGTGPDVRTVRGAFDTAKFKRVLNGVWAVAA